jgi:hypothetical protein
MHRWYYSFISLLPCPTWAFAGWLKCNRQLEEDEIIMNNRVVRYHENESEGSVVKLAVYSGSTRVDVASSSSSGEGGSVVWVDDDASYATTTYVIGIDQTTTSDLSDIQFVIETTPFHSTPSPRPSPTPNIPTAKAPQRKVNKTSFTGASTGGGVLCDGSRAHARRFNGNVTYTLVKGSNNDSSVIAEVWGGWSEYHGPVTLTPRITFKRKEESVSTDKNDVGAGDDHQGEL